MKNFLKLMLCTLLLPALSFAQAKEVNILVHSNSSPVAAEGLLFASKGIERIAETEVAELREGQYLVSYRFNPKRISATALATAAIINEDNERIVGDVIAPFRRVNSRHNLPLCPVRSRIKPKLRKNSSSLNKLLEIRTLKRENRREKLESMLTLELAEKIEKLENDFGISHEPALSLKAHPLSIIDRLSKLLHAIQSYKAHRELQSEQAAKESTDEEQDLEATSAENELQ